MNPAGLRLDEKKTAEPGDNVPSSPPDLMGSASYKSTHSSRSSVLERAREYNRRIEQSDLLEQPSSRRAKSLDRGRRGPVNGSRSTNGTTPRSTSTSHTTPRSSSQQRQQYSSSGQQPSPARSRSASATGRRTHSNTRERAMASVRNDMSRKPTTNTTSRGGEPAEQASQQQQQSYQRESRPSSASRSQQQPRTSTDRSASSQPRKNSGEAMTKSVGSRQSSQKQRPAAEAQPPQQEQQENAVVTPELLVDALSGQEEGLLAIAERLMEHYDGGYDVMGEALIDAFADVQKLFQHVVEAAHMEGAAFEASRRDAEVRERAGTGAVDDPILAYSQDQGDPTTPPPPSSPAGPNRHDEFIDNDVKDVLTDAIRKGSALRDKSQNSGGKNVDQECYQLYVQACQSASALLPVDSDHRGRLQLSLARGESMSPDRACAILRYAMDDVLRSGMRAHNTPLPDPSKRADMVLAAPSTTHAQHSSSGGGGAQRADEALASLMEEMKEVMSAPVYKDTPLQAVAQRFWTALAEQQKSQHKTEERLEQNLAKLKGDYLLARAEWEEKLTRSQEVADSYRSKYDRLKEQMKGEDYMEQARSFAARLGEGKTDESATSSAGNQTNSDLRSVYGSVRSATQNRAGSVASLGSGLAQHAKTLVNSMKDFNCNAPNMATTTAGDERNEAEKDEPYYSGGRDSSRSRSSPRYGSQQRSRSATSSRNKTSRSYREYSRSPQRVDV